ncbi:MAG TPA: HEAT repeat domain-containing protein [Tepidisphaeraceae bacterium]|nr:HEAT repeat domain-containing protein [Tepidisphaeraceae bacterium]
MGKVSGLPPPLSTILGSPDGGVIDESGWKIEDASGMEKRFVTATILAGAALAAGCASHGQQTPEVGLIPPAERAADLRDDHIRLLGEDHAPAVELDEPFWDLPFLAVGAATNYLIVEPCVHFWRNFTGDTPQAATRLMYDNGSADNRRIGMFRLADFAYAREGGAERDAFAEKASFDPDYTVRAAGIRILNRCRDSARTQVYIQALREEKPLVRLEAVKALANVPDPQAVEPLLDILQHDDSRDVRIACADALRCYKTDEVAHALISELNDYDFGVAWQARQSLRLMTAHDFQYSEADWLNYLAASRNPFE